MTSLKNVAAGVPVAVMKISLITTSSGKVVHVSPKVAETPTP
jgi:hypothetical protein